MKLVAANMAVCNCNYFRQ